MPVELTFLDYGVGNLHSLRKACEAAGARVDVADRPQDVLRAKALVLPGVGAFGKVAEMVAPIRRELKGRFEGGLPALCVCIGMQVLFDSSEEAPGDGIGLLPGAVRRLRHQRLPHIGWNSVKHGGRGLFEGLPDGASFYFVHTFAPSSCGDGIVGTTDYGGSPARREFRTLRGGKIMIGKRTGMPALSGRPSGRKFSRQIRTGVLALSEHPRGCEFSRQINTGVLALSEHPPGCEFSRRIRTGVLALSEHPPGCESK